LIIKIFDVRNIPDYLYISGRKKAYVFLPYIIKAAQAFASQLAERTAQNTDQIDTKIAGSTDLLSGMVI
jgi:hypothetical protein